MTVVALMEATSFYGGVRHKRYSGQQEIAPNKKRPVFTERFFV
jgi:hypothetical protein